MVFTKMAMKVEVTEEFVGSINNAVHAWKRDPMLYKLHRYFDVLCEEEYGVKVDWVVSDSGAVQINGAELIDEEKYILFLLKFGEVHNG